MIKLVACDLDGTLLNAMHELDEEDSRIIHELQKKNIQFMIATGRNYGSIMNLICDYDIQCDCIILNGGLIMNSVGDVLEETPLSYDILKQLIDLIHKEHLVFHMFGDNGTSTFDAKRGREEALSHVMNGGGFSKEEALTIIEKGKFGVYDKEYRDEAEFYAIHPTIYKVELFMKDMDAQKIFRKKLEQIEGIEVTNSVVDNIEITSTRAQKGIALADYCKKRGIKKEEVLVFGDSLNDLNMIEMFPNSFAVANAIASIKEKANYITDSNVDHGVTNVLKAVLNSDGSDEFLKNFKNNVK